MDNARKKIKSSKRGLTFTSDHLSIGTHFKYIINKNDREILIVPCRNGKGTVSKKKSGKRIKPLIDIRSSEVREIIRNADSLEIQVRHGGSVLVRVIRNRAYRQAEIISIQELLQQNVSEFIIPARMLAVSGMGTRIERTLFDEEYFEYLKRSAPSFVWKKKKKEISKVYDVVSLFSGAGMLDKAFLDKRFRFVYGVDFEPSAVKTYRENIGDHIECRDIRDVNAEEIPHADLVIGGPCCQAYSNENRHNMGSEEAEKKRLLIDDYARIVLKKNPKVWVVENVPELLTKDQGFYLNRLFEKLSNYEITAKIIADDKAGGYSVRRRAVVIGSRIGKIELPDAELKAGTVREALAKVNAEWFNYNDITVPKQETAQKMSFIPQGGNWRDIPAEYNTYGPHTHSCIMRRLEWDKPSITLCNFRKSNILHPEENRILSVAEAAAIMGLDKSFHFLGTLAEKQQMVANGVTQAIGKLIRNTVLKALDNSENILDFSIKTA